MQGAGNDFIIIDNRIEKLSPEEFGPLAAKLCTRRMSIGADGFMVVENPSEGGDYKMLFYNADGSLGEMCGNGARCIARYGYENGLGGAALSIETTAGLVKAWRLSETEYKVKLNDVTRMDIDMELSVDGDTYNCAYVELGSPGIPHLILEYPNLEKTNPKELWQLGSTLRHHPQLPKGANVNFYEIIRDDNVFERTFERGVEDFTNGCGTGTASMAAVLTTKGLVSGNHIEVHMAGGQLDIDIAQNDQRQIKDLYLSGPSIIVAEGIIKEIF